MTADWFFRSWLIDHANLQFLKLFLDIFISWEGFPKRISKKIQSTKLTLVSFFQQDGMNCMKGDLHNGFTYEMLAHTKKVCQLFKSGAPEAL